MHDPPLCHPDRSVAQWRDLLCAPPERNCAREYSPSHVIDAEVNVTLHLVIPTGAQRSGGTCCAPSQTQLRGEYREFVASAAPFARFRPAGAVSAGSAVDSAAVCFAAPVVASRSAYSVAAYSAAAYSVAAYSEGAFAE